MERRARKPHAQGGLRIPVGIKLAVAFVIVVAPFLAWQSYTATETARAHLVAEIDRGGVGIVSAMGATIDPGWLEGDAGQKLLQEKLPALRRSQGLARVLEIIAYNSAGEALATATASTLFTKTRGALVENEQAAAARVEIRELEYEGLPVRSYTGPAGLGRLEVYVPVSEIRDAGRALAAALLRVSVTAALCAAGAAFLLAGLLTRPVRTLVLDMRQVSHGDLDHRSSLTTRDELGDLARAFNSMTAELQAAEEIKLSQRALEHELGLATRIQNRLLPTEIPAIEGLAIMRHYAPAREVGGDYYDVIRIDDSHLGLVVADVSGKGIPAALIMTMTRSLLHMAARGETSPARTLDRLNRALAPDLQSGMFVSMVYVVIDTLTLEVRLGRAGHNPPLLRSAATGAVTELATRGLALGIDREGSRFSGELQIQRLALKKGEVLVLYTDGIVEGRSRAGGEYGVSRLTRVLGSAVGGPAAIGQAIVEDLARHTKGAEPSDDVTLLVIGAV